jgi:hypothetical protein
MLFHSAVHRRFFPKELFTTKNGQCEQGISCRLKSLIRPAILFGGPTSVFRAAPKQPEVENEVVHEFDNRY